MSNEPISQFGIQQRQSNSYTQTTIAVYNARLAGKPSPDGKWLLICEEHNERTYRKSIHSAKRAASCPAWCSQCKPVIDAVSAAMRDRTRPAPQTEQEYAERYPHSYRIEQQQKQRRFYRERDAQIARILGWTQANEVRWYAPIHKRILPHFTTDVGAAMSALIDYGRLYRIVSNSTTLNRVVIVQADGSESDERGDTLIDAIYYTLCAAAGIEPLELE